MHGKFITLEGLDGAGKSTHLGWLRTALEQRGIALIVTREPGGTRVGETLRGLLLDPAQRLHPETEALLMFAARREHIATVIQPALEAGQWVLCDRFTDASYAYQAGGSGVAWQKIEALETWVHAGLDPDLTLYFDVDPAQARTRAGAVRAADRYEQEQQAFHERVRGAYLRRAKEYPARIRVLDANRRIPEVQAELERIVLEICK